MLAERAAVPFGEIGVGLAQRAQQAAGQRGGFAAEEFRDRVGDFVAELVGACVHRLGEHQQAHGLIVS